MTALPIARVSAGMSNALLASDLNTTSVQLLKVEQQISTGQRLNLPSDDPAATVQIELDNFQQSTNTQYTSNLNFASSFLATADSSLTSLSGLLTQAQSTASADAGSTTSATQRATDAQIINSLIQQAYNIGNTRYQGASVFGGANGVSDAFSAANGGYQYQGSSDAQGILTADGSTLDYTVNGAQAFGGASAVITGTQNLTPALTATTRLADLGGATNTGCSPGAVSLTYGGTTVNVDLSSAATVGDVTSLLNQAFTANGIPATASTAGGALTIDNTSTTGGLTIADAIGSSAATTLGINGTAALSSTLTGGNLTPKITPLTPLSALNNGTGIDPSGLILSNGTTSSTISLAGMTTVQDLLNAINGSAVGAQAQINAAGNGINILNNTSGVPLTVGENGGQTADELGVRSFTASTQLSALNNGAGFTPISQTATGATGNIVVTGTNGTSFNVPVNGITTPSQLISAINSATGNSSVTAALNSTGNGITLTDSSGGAGNVSVSQASNYVSNGTNLGLFATGTGGTLTGGNMTFSTDDFRITKADGTSFTVNTTGATTIQDILNKINTADGNAGSANPVTASLATNGNGIVLTDSSTGPDSLTVTATNGSSVLAQLGLNQTAVGNTVTGTDTNPVQTQGIFSSLIQLRNALANNDTAGITQAAQLLNADVTRVTTAQGVVGAREQDISNRKSVASNTDTQLTQTLSNLEATDMTTAATELQTLQTAYQSTLEVFQTVHNQSLLDFLQ